MVNVVNAPLEDLFKCLTPPNHPLDSKRLKNASKSAKTADGKQLKWRWIVVSKNGKPEKIESKFLDQKLAKNETSNLKTVLKTVEMILSKTSFHSDPEHGETGLRQLKELKDTLGKRIQNCHAKNNKWYHIFYRLFTKTSIDLTYYKITQYVDALTIGLQGDTLNYNTQKLQKEVEELTAKAAPIPGTPITQKIETKVEQVKREMQEKFDSEKLALKGKFAIESVKSSGDLEKIKAAYIEDLKAQDKVFGDILRGKDKNDHPLYKQTGYVKLIEETREKLKARMNELNPPPPSTDIDSSLEEESPVKPTPPAPSKPPAAPQASAIPKQERKEEKKGFFAEFFS